MAQLADDEKRVGTVQAEGEGEGGADKIFLPCVGTTAYSFADIADLKDDFVMYFLRYGYGIEHFLNEFLAYWRHAGYVEDEDGNKTKIQMNRAFIFDFCSFWGCPQIPEMFDKKKQVVGKCDNNEGYHGDDPKFVFSAELSDATFQKALRLNLFHLSQNIKNGLKQHDNMLLFLITQGFVESDEWQKRYDISDKLKASYHARNIQPEMFSLIDELRARGQVDSKVNDDGVLAVGNTNDFATVRNEERSVQNKPELKSDKASGGSQIGSKNDKKNKKHKKHRGNNRRQRRNKKNRGGNKQFRKKDDKNDKGDGGDMINVD